MIFFVLIIFSFIFSSPVLAASAPYLTELNVSASQWVEIYNPDTASINLNGWKIGNQSGPQSTISNLEIGATSYGIFNIDSATFKVEEGNYVELWNGSNSISRAPSYNSNTLSSYSWSRQSDNNWCLANSSKNSSNSSCHVTPTNTPMPTLTPSPTKIPTPTKAPTPTLEIAPTLEPTSTPQITIQDIQITDPVTDISNQTTPKKNNIGLIFIILGGLLLLSPLLITKIQQWRSKPRIR